MKTPRTRRDFVFTATKVCAAFGAAAVSWPLIASFKPSKDTVSKRIVQNVDVSMLEPGQQMRLFVGTRLVFIRYRTPSEIEQAQMTPLSELLYPETDRSRLRPLPNGTYNPKYLVLDGACPRFGCTTTAEAGDYDGWYCRCCMSHYDTSGRVRKGVSHENMAVPWYRYISETMIRLETITALNRLSLQQEP